jgi:hypothetical protein
VFSQKLFQFPCIQAMRYCCQIYDTDRAARGQKPAFTENLSTPVLIEGQPFFRRSHDEQKERLPVAGPKRIFKLSNPPGDCSQWPLFSGGLLSRL